MHRFECLLGMLAVDLDVREQLMGLRRVLGVLRRLQDVQRALGIERRLVRLPLERVQPRLRPVEASSEDRVSRIRRQLERPREQLLGLVEGQRVDVRVREENREASGLDLVTALFGGGQRLVEDRDRGLELVDHRVRPAKRVRSRRLVDEAIACRLRAPPRCVRSRPGDRRAGTRPALALPRRALDRPGPRPSRALPRTARWRRRPRPAEARAPPARGSQLRRFAHCRSRGSPHSPRVVVPSPGAAAATESDRPPRSSRCTRASSPGTRAGVGSIQPDRGLL